MSIYKPGDFSFYKDFDFREALEYDFKVIQKIGLWTMLKNHNAENTLMFSGKLDNYEFWDGHSAASLGYSIRIMENIAKNGWDNYVNTYLSYKLI